MSALSQHASMIALGSGGGGGTDPFFANVSALLHLDSNLNDVTGKVWTPNGTITYDTSTPLYGSGSGVFAAALANATSASSADFNFGTGDFTVELAFRFPSGSTPANGYLFDMGAGNLTVIQTTQTGKLAYYDPVTGTGSTLYTAGPGPTSFADGNRHTVAVTRSGTTVRAFFDGVMWASGTSNHNKTHTTACINKYGGDNTHGNVNITMDEVRVTKGVARYISNYFPATSPFPDSA